MHLTKMFAVSALLSFCVAGAEPAKDIFHLTDGYYQVGLFQPMHLTHQPLDRHVVYLGDTFRLWITVALNASAQSPCARRSENTCSMTLEIASGKKTEKVWESKGLRIDDGVSFFVPGLATRSLDLGEAVVLFRISFKETTLYQLDIPVEIR